MRLLGAATLAVVMAGTGAGGSPPPSGWSSTLLYGRWQTNQQDQQFSRNGRAYRSVDIVPCGAGFCGVSVASNGACGATLFRFPSHRRSTDDQIRGRAIWGSAPKNLAIEYHDKDHPSEYDGDDQRVLQIYLGNGHSFSERGGSMPVFVTTYDPHGAARCRAR